MLERFCLCILAATTYCGEVQLRLLKWELFKSDGAPQTNHSAITVAVLVCLLVAAELLTEPWGNFPLNDDWIYAYSVKSLLEGKVLITNWLINTSLIHILSGALGCSLSGFSFETLRLTVLFWSAVSLVSTWFLVRQVGATLGLRVLTVLLIAINPLFFSLSNSFMTDITGLALSTVAVLEFANFFRTKLQLHWWLALLALVLSVLTRQAMLVTGLGFAITYIAFNKRSFKNFAVAFSPLLISGVAFVMWQFFIERTFGPVFGVVADAQYFKQCLMGFPLILALQILSTFIKISFYLGGLMLPVCLVVAPWVFGSVDQKTRLFLLLLVAELSVMTAGASIWTGLIMPLSDNVIFDTGLGPVLMDGAGPTLWSKAPKAVWVAVTVFCAIGASFLWTYLGLFMRRIFMQVRAKKEIQNEDIICIFLFNVLVIYVGALLVHSFFDRYLIPCLPLIPVILIRLAFQQPVQVVFHKRVFVSSAVIVLSVFAFYCIAGTHDYFAWNRAKWQAIESVLKSGVEPINLDAGLEFNSWSTYTLQKPLPPYSSDCPPHNNLWLIATGPLKGFEVWRKYPFKRWLLPITEDVFLLHKH